MDVIVAPYEADAQLAYLVREKLVDAVCTIDSDLVVFGCDTVSVLVIRSNLPHSFPHLHSGALQGAGHGGV